MCLYLPLAADSVAKDKQLIQQHIQQQGSLKIKSHKMFLCGPPCTGKTATMLRLSNQIHHLKDSDPPLPSTGFEKPRTLELYCRTVKRTVCVSSVRGEVTWKLQDLEEQGATIYSCIIHQMRTSSPVKISPSLTNAPSEFTNANENSSHFCSDFIKKPTLNSESVDGNSFSVQKMLLNKAVENSSEEEKYIVSDEDWHKVQEELKTIEDVTILHMIDSGGHPECHEILPLLMEGPALNLIFFNLDHDLNEKYKVVFRSKEMPANKNGYESVFTAKQVIDRFLSSISCLQSQDHDPVALLVGTHLDLVSEEAVLTLDKYIQEAFKAFTEKDILFPVDAKAQKYIATLDNMSDDQSDVNKLREVIQTIIDTRLKPKPMPTGWLLLHLLLRLKYEKEPGWCTLEECGKIAKACGLKEEELSGEDGILRAIHINFGTLLYYPNVPGLCNKVICDPNLILHPITQILIFSYASNHGYSKQSERSRTTGEISDKLIDHFCSFNHTSSKPIPTPEIVALLKDNYILYENVHALGKERKYFMPILLRPDHSFAITDPILLPDLNPAPLQLIPISVGYIPLGLFPALLVKLSHDWDLEKERFRNRIQFCIDQAGKSTKKVELRQYPSYLALHLIRGQESVDVEGLEACRHQLWDALHEVSSKYSHMADVEWQHGFYCPGSLLPGIQPHSAVYKAERKSLNMRCHHEPHCKKHHFLLKDEHKSWFKVS